MHITCLPSCQAGPRLGARPDYSILLWPCVHETTGSCQSAAHASFAYIDMQANLQQHYQLSLSLQVCNHPDLFEGRPIVSSFDMFGFPFHLPSAAMHALTPPLWQDVGIASINADILAQEENTCWAAQETQAIHLLPGCTGQMVCFGKGA